MKGSIACSASPVLPAVLMSSPHCQYLPPVFESSTKLYTGDVCPVLPGLKSKVLLPLSAPDTVALQARASQFTQARCCALRPPPADLLPRTLLILIGIFVSADSPTARRISCPPPSRVRPSRSMDLDIWCVSMFRGLETIAYRRYVANCVLCGSSDSQKTTWYAEMG